MEPIITALITGGMALTGVIITNINSNRSIEHKIAISQAVMETKIESLANEVRRHNDFATRIPTIETEIEHIMKDTQEIEKKIERMTQ